MPRSAPTITRQSTLWASQRRRHRPPLACTQYPNTLRGRPARLSPPSHPLPRQRQDATYPALPFPLLAYRQP
eukprot:scaffold78973_cov66-Phaeocystis_antarctica.AAC.1